MAEIQLRNIVKRFGDTTAIKGASFTVRDGEFFILVGPSGCGKSSLLNIIVGLERANSGEILVGGERVDQLDPKDRNMAMVFQNYAIYPHMSVRENLAFPLRLAKTPSAEIDRRVGEAARVLELEQLLERKPRALSGGQRQRVAMGRAMVREPRAFLLDEPLSNLDAKLRQQLRTEIARLQRRLRTTTVYVTHDQTEALTLGDRIAVMHRGEVLQIGTPRQLYERPGTLFVAGFIGSPAMNFLPARAAAGRLELPIGRVGLDESRQWLLETHPGQLIAGFRPEHLQVIGADTEWSDGLCFDPRVEVVEWLGADLLVYVDVPLEGFAAMRLPEELGIEAGHGGSRSLVARTDPGVRVQEGDRLRLGLAPRHLHLFDADSGAALAAAD